MAVSITRTNSRTGKVERPWRNREDLFVLGDPAHGAQKHHDKFAVKVRTLEEVATLVGRGFSVRMTDGESPPSLISPDSLLVEQVDDADPAARWADTAPKPPFEKQAMMAELKTAMLVQANQIAHAGSLDYAVAFMGFETSNPSYPYVEDDADSVDLDRFAATSYLDLAYDYAFQVERFWRFGDDTAQDVEEFIRGANPRGNDGCASPLASPDRFCRRAADTAFGRWKLETGYDLTVRELALLAQMKEPAVRNSLSKERIALERGGVDANVALAWLGERRDFIPTRKEEGRKAYRTAHSRFVLEREPFAKAFSQLMRYFDLSPAALALKAQVEEAFVSELLAGKPQPDLASLRRVGEALEIDAPHFVGIAVQTAMRET